MKRSILFLISWLFLVSLAHAVEVKFTIRTERPVGIRYLYYTLKDGQGKTLSYLRLPGNKATTPKLMRVPYLDAGPLRLETSFGKFAGTVDGLGRVTFSHPYIQQQENEIVIVNRHSLEVSFRTFSPTNLRKVLYLVLSTSGQTKKQTVPGSTSNLPVKLHLQNIVPGLIHFSTSFGHFAAQLEDKRLVFNYRGKKIGILKVPLHGGKNHLYIQTKVTTSQKGFVPPVVNETVKAIIKMPSQVEMNSPNGVTIRLDGRSSKASSKAEYLWSFPGGKARGSYPQVLLRPGHQMLHLKIQDGPASQSSSHSIRVKDTLPPTIEGKYIPIPGGLYRLQLEVTDQGDSLPSYTALLPLPNGFKLAKKEVASLVKLTWTKEGLEIQGPQPDSMWKAIVRDRGIVFDPQLPLQIRSHSGNFTLVIPPTGPWKLEGRIPSLLVEAIDRWGNRQKKSIPFRLFIPKSISGETPKKNNPPAKNSPLSPLEVLLSALACFIVIGLLFLRGKDQEF